MSNIINFALVTYVVLSPWLIVYLLSLYYTYKEFYLTESKCSDEYYENYKYLQSELKKLKDVNYRKAQRDREIGKGDAR